MQFFYQGACAWGFFATFRKAEIYFMTRGIFLAYL